MSEYILGVIGTVLLCSILTVISPEGKTSTMIKGATRLACILVIIAPVLRFLGEGDVKDISANGKEFFGESVIQTDEEFIKYYSEMRMQNVAVEIEQELQKEYAITASVFLEWEEVTDTYAGYAYEKIQITKIRLDIAEDQEKEAQEEMLEYLRKNYCCEVLLE